MEARAIGDIMQIPAAERPAILSQGLGLLVEHLGELRDASLRLRECAHARGAAILDCVRSEEAAKALVLVDVARLGWRDHTAVSRHLRHFSDHVARGIYAEVTALRPATFGEVRELVERMRRSQYLDGPNDIDWSFRNEIEAAREEAFYVDYIKDDDGHRWISPRDRYSASTAVADGITDLVITLDHLGVFSAAGLGCVVTAWDGVELTDSYHWQDHVQRVEAALLAIERAGLVGRQATEGDVQLVYDRWTFPMGSLELVKRRIPSSELEDERRRATDRMWLEMVGPPDHDPPG